MADWKPPDEAQVVQPNWSPPAEAQTVRPNGTEKVVDYFGGNPKPVLSEQAKKEMGSTVKQWDLDNADWENAQREAMRDPAAAYVQKTLPKDFSWSGLGEALWDTGKQLLHMVTPPSPTEYLQMEERFLSGQMSREEAAGFTVMHALPGAAKELAQQRDQRIIGPDGEAGFNKHPPEPENVIVPPEVPLDNIKTPEQATLTIKELNQQIKDMSAEGGLRWDNKRGYVYENSRGPLSEGEMLDLADRLGLAPREMNGNRINQLFTPEEVHAAGELVDQSAGKLLKDMENATDEAGLDKFNRSLELHEMLLDHIAGREAESIREPRVSAEGKEIETVGAAREAELQKAQTITEQGAKLETPEEVNNYVQATRRVGTLGRVFDWAIELRNMGLLTGWVTHDTYAAFGNPLTLLMSIGEAVPEAAVGAARRLVTGGTEGARFSEVLGRVYGVFSGWQRGAYTWGKIMQEDPRGFLLGEKPNDKFVEALTSREIPGILGKAIRAWPNAEFRLVHTSFGHIAVQEYLAGSAFRQASAEGLRLGSPEFRARVGNLMDIKNITPSRVAEIDQRALDQVFLGRGGGITNFLSQLSNEYRAARFLFPFIRMFGNIMRQGFMERTPLGVFDQTIRDNLTGKNGPEAFDRQWGRMAIGAAGITTFIGLLASGKMTGGPPEVTATDIKTRMQQLGEREVWLDQHQPYSFNMWGKWISYERLGSPISELAKLIADGYQTVDRMSKRQASEWAATVYGALIGGPLNNGWIRDLSDVLGAMQDPSKFERWIRSQATNFVPYSSFLRQTAQMIDPVLREARNLPDALKAMTPIPSIREELKPKLDVWGEPIARRGLFGITALWEQPVRNSPLDDALNRIGVFPTTAPRHIRGQELSDDEHFVFGRVLGRLTRARLTELISRPGFEDRSVGVQGELVRKVIDSTRKFAEDLVLNNYPELREKALEARRAKFQGE